MKKQFYTLACLAGPLWLAEPTALNSSHWQNSSAIAPVQELAKFASSLFQLQANDSVFISRSWMNVHELIEKTNHQLGRTHFINVEDSLGKMVLYDALATAPEVREAVVEYYVYVLGQMVRWDKEGPQWILRRHWDIDLPLKLDLPSLEEELVEKLKSMPEEEQMAFSKEQMLRIQTEGAIPPWVSWRGEEQLDDVSLSWWQRSLGALNALWREADDETRRKLRRQWRHDIGMGRVPLVALVMSGRLDFKMGGEAQVSEHFSMEPNKNEALTDSSNPEAINRGQASSRERQWAWPKRILSFSPKHWWSFFGLERSEHKPEKKLRPVSRRVLERRDQAKAWFESARDNFEERQRNSRTRRELNP